MEKNIEEFRPPAMVPVRTAVARGCELLNPHTEALDHCGKPAVVKFETRSPWFKEHGWYWVYACSVEHAVAEAEGLWGIGQDVR
jgi:hypothetical protein